MSEWNDAVEAAATCAAAPAEGLVYTRKKTLAEAISAIRALKRPEAEHVQSSPAQAMNFHYVPAHQCGCSIFKTGTCDCEPSQVAIVQACIGPKP